MKIEPKFYRENKFWTKLNRLQRPKHSTCMCSISAARFFFRTQRKSTFVGKLQQQNTALFWFLFFVVFFPFPLWFLETQTTFTSALLCFALPECVLWFFLLLLFSERAKHTRCVYDRQIVWQADMNECVLCQRRFNFKRKMKPIKILRTISINLQTSIDRRTY